MSTIRNERIPQVPELGATPDELSNLADRIEQVHAAVMSHQPLNEVDPENVGPYSFDLVHKGQRARLSFTQDPDTTVWTVSQRLESPLVDPATGTVTVKTRTYPLEYGKGGTVVRQSYPAASTLRGAYMEPHTSDPLTIPPLSSLDCAAATSELERCVAPRGSVWQRIFGHFVKI